MLVRLIKILSENTLRQNRAANSRDTTPQAAGRAVGRQACSGGPGGSTGPGDGALATMNKTIYAFAF